MDVDSDKSQAQLELKRDPYSPAPLIYSNSVQANFTPEDFTLHFGYYFVPPLTAPPTEPISVNVEMVARVALPVNLVRSVIAVLERQVTAYEESFGAIPEHPNKPDWMIAERQDS